MRRDPLDALFSEYKYGIRNLTHSVSGGMIIKEV